MTLYTRNDPRQAGMTDNKSITGNSNDPLTTDY
jgi:hypothetical protein